MKKRMKNKKNNYKIANKNREMNNSFLGAGYFFGFIGAVVYFIQSATSFWGGVLGFLKALVWPAFLVYELFKFLA